MLNSTFVRVLSCEKASVAEGFGLVGATSTQW